MNVAVFCSSSNDLNPVFHKEAELLGQFIGSKRYTLVYGGSKNGLMETLAQSANQNGAYIIGILLQDMRAQSSKFVNEMLFVESLCERKELLSEYADVFVVLPGGIGTLDEMFSVLAEVQVGTLDKQLLLVNIAEFYTPLLSHFENMLAQKFAVGTNKNSFSVVNSVAECIKWLEDKAV
jgi:uncharacterized protein (TIGR00730 family)